MRRLRESLALIIFFVAAIAAWFVPTEAGAVERNFAGSAQLDYHLVPTTRNATAAPGAIDGFTVEFAGKLAVDFSERLSGNAKACFGCHGFEADMLYIDYRLADEVNIRIGRFSPSFGAFNLRHDTANHRLSDKPLPYDMGRMLRMRTWNMGVLPSPFPDNGIEVNGVHWFGEKAEVDYAVYAVTGFKGDNRTFDIDFKQSRTPQTLYIDNNARPTVGARVGSLIKLSESSDLSFGASAMYGTWNPDNTLSYMILGGDASLRAGSTTVRAEYLVRKQDFDPVDPLALKFPITSTHFLKHGAYVEVEQALTNELDVILRGDMLARAGNVERSSPLGENASILRGTLGVAYAIERGLRLKLSGEAWRFSGADANGRTFDLGFHTAAVGSF